MISNPTSILVRHNRWATENLIAACQELSEAQFHQRFDMGPGSLHDTITHILGAMRGWSDLLAGNEQRPRLEAGDQRSAEELAVLLAEISDEFESLATSNAADEVVSGERGGKTWSFTRGAVVTHVTTHGMHHRAQCLNMLRHLGVASQPPSAVVDWVLMTNPDS